MATQQTARTYLDLARHEVQIRETIKEKATWGTVDELKFLVSALSLIVKLEDSTLGKERK